MSDSRHSINFVFYLYFGIAITALLIALSLGRGPDVIWINSHHSEVLDEIFKGLTRLGEGWIFVPVIILSLFVRFAWAFMVLSVGIINGVVCSLVKQWIFADVSRPIGVLDNSLLYFVPGVDVHAMHSFPSGHTATIFCAAILVSLLTRMRWITLSMAMIAIGVACSRMYLLQHFLLDVSGGVIIATAICFPAWYFFSRAKAPSWMNQAFELRRTQLDGSGPIVIKTTPPPQDVVHQGDGDGLTEQ